MLLKRLHRSIGLAGAASALLVLASCGGSGPAADVAPQASAGQVATAGGAARVSFYAASRFAEQASFGPTPALVAEIQAKGYERWIDAQFALPPSQIDPRPAYLNGNPIPPEPYRHLRAEYWQQVLRAPDALRVRLAWSIGQFITVSESKGHPVGTIEWINLLHRQAFGTYRDLLLAISTSPKMGDYLDNTQNRPKSAQCPRCAPNENFARELLQLFSIGVYQLEPDGSPRRNSRGGYIETYTQTDVEELARALTGWQFQNDPFDPDSRYKTWARPMVQSGYGPDRDVGSKRVLGKTFLAGQSAPADLQDAVALLMAHPNIAPFVSLRFIQHLVKSNPSPAYLGRVAAVFRNNGQGEAGDLKAVVKAVLLDPEARAGDDPARTRPDDGKVREPMLHRAAVFRALGCARAPTNNTSGDYFLGAQRPWNPDSVFSFYSPADRAPGSNLLAPEQKLLIASELTARLNEFNGTRFNQTTRGNDLSAYDRAGCSLDALMKAFNTSPAAYSDLLSQSFFRGAMPPTLRATLDQLMRNPTWNTANPDEGAMRMLGFALATPYFGVMP